MRGHGLTVLLLLLAVGLGLWLWRDRDRVTEGERARRENNVFPAWRRDELSRLEIAHEGEAIVLERDAKLDGSWRMTSPREERADHAAVERLITTLEFATVVRKMAGAGAGVGHEQDDKTLGFDAPRAHGSIAMGRLAIRFVLGGTSPRPEGSGYLAVDGGVPFVASKELVDALLARSETYRDRTVIPYLSLDLARFEVTHPGGGFRVDRSDERSFKVDGLDVFASRSAIDKVWGTLAEIRAEAFPKDADADALTAHPRLTILMAPKDAAKAPGELVVGDACPGHPDDVVVLRRQPTRVAACAPRGAIDALLSVTPASLVDRRLFSFRPDEIEELRLEWLTEPALSPAPAADAGAPSRVRAIEIARRGTGYHQREPVDVELAADEADAASELLGRIDLAGATEVRPGRGAPFHAVARARVRSGEHEETVEIGAPESALAAETGPVPGSTILRRVRDDARLAVPPAVARRLEPRRTTFRPRTLLPETRRVHGVILRCGAPQDFTDQGAGLKLTSPAGYETDGSIVQLVDALLKGKVLAWVADADDGSFGLLPPSTDAPCRVVLTFEDGNAPTTIRLGAEGEGGVYGAVSGQSDVFSAPVSLKTLVGRIYVSHAALRVEASQVESVKVTSHGGAVVTRDPAALRDVVSSLYADRVVSLGGQAPSARGAVESPDLELTIATAEGGPPKRVLCGAAVGAVRRCSTPSVNAVFEVKAATLARLFAAPASARDAARDAP